VEFAYENKETDEIEDAVGDEWYKYCNKEMEY
jgi:hypothetical protein